MKNGPLHVERKPLRLTADEKRVIARLFIPGGEKRTKLILNRVLSLSDTEVSKLYKKVVDGFSHRHKNLDTVFQRHFDEVAGYLPSANGLSEQHRLLIGAYFTSEYSLESVALFNPSIVPHPDQTGLAPGAARFIMSLRACGEGHISSIEFRSGVIDADNNITFDPVSSCADTEKPLAHKLYEKHVYFLKLIEIGSYNDIAERILALLADRFTLNDLERTINEQRRNHNGTDFFTQTAEDMLWLARSNYNLEFSGDSDISERVIFPVTENESRGIEDARFVRFTYDDGRVVYYATYTAYNGFRALPQFIETEDFRFFKVITLNGRCAQQKGMALFPRKIDNQYVMISRHDGESLSILFSENIHFWNLDQNLQQPHFPWEFMQIGNCGSPMETEHGWLLLTHGVGPMRQYCIGVTLLDLQNPARVIAQLKEPLIVPNENERDGYVPNVVYSCGGMIHNDELIIPYAVSDSATSIATVSLDKLFDHLLSEKPHTPTP